MKRLNITKERFEKSRYFTRKYGTLEYVSESGKVYKTSKGNLIRFNEDGLDDVPFQPKKRDPNQSDYEDDHKNIGKQQSNVMYKWCKYITGSSHNGDKLNGRKVRESKIFSDIEDCMYDMLETFATTTACEDGSGEVLEPTEEVWGGDLEPNEIEAEPSGTAKIEYYAMGHEKHENIIGKIVIHTSAHEHVYEILPVYSGK